jgi:UDP-GlcNAc:undecaprenyl-phosphate/decaprenyl-phosphate GlcNAc-1-phosphate transferase
MLPESAILDIAFLFITFFTSLLISLLLVPLSSRLALYLNIIDHPDPRKIHAVATPRMGGVAIALSMILATLICIKLANPVKAFLLGAGFIILTGLIDDKFQLSAKIKFIGQILAAVVFIQSGNYELQTLGNLFGIGNVGLGFLAPVITAFCMIGVMNALNLSDGLDGLATGIGVIAALFFAAVAYDHQAWHWSGISLILLGVLLGFLRYNHYPAKLFMGDTGSLLIGYTLAAIAVGLARPEQAAVQVAPISVAIILGLPIFDTIWVMTRRVFLGKNPFKPDKTHLHHRLMQMGISHAGVVTVIYGIMLFLGFWAYILRHLPEWQQFYLTISVFMGCYGILSRMEKRGKDLGELIDSIRIIKPNSRLLLNRRVERIFYFIPFILFAMLFIPAYFITPIPRLLGVFSFAGALFIALLYPWKSARGKILFAHGLVYAGCFFLLLIYALAPSSPGWLLAFLTICSFLAFLWVVIKILISRDDPILYPSSFEILLMLFSWFIPIVLIPILDLGFEIQRTIIIICVQTVPLLCLAKLTVRRYPVRNRFLAFSFIGFFFILGALAFL